MKRTASLACLAAALSLGACADNDAAEEETAATEAVAVPAASETTVVREVDGDADRSAGDRVSVDADGVRADVRDGDTRVRADVGEDPSLTVETD